MRSQQGARGLALWRVRFGHGNGVGGPTEESKHMGDLKTARRNFVDELFIGPFGLAEDYSLEFSCKALIYLKT
jgi:hypothetical protein